MLSWSSIVISMTKIDNSSVNRGANWGLAIGVPIGYGLFLWIAFTQYYFPKREVLCLAIFLLPIALGGMFGGAIGGAIAGITQQESERNKLIRLLGSLGGALVALFVGWLILEFLSIMFIS